MASTRFPRFQARAPWWGADLQTIRNSLRPPSLAPFPGERVVRLPLADATGDVLLAPLACSNPTPRGLVVLIHGLGGSEDSGYVRVSAAHLRQRGYAVARLNLRGAGPTRALCRERYHAGRTADLGQALHRLRKEAPEFAALPLFCVGYSLGGNLLLKFLSEDCHGMRIAAAVSVSAPIDLAAASAQIAKPRNALYQRYLLIRMREEALHPSAGLNEAEREVVRSVDSVYAFDDQIVAPRNGYRDAPHYYAENASGPRLPEIRTRTLLIHAQDDPWIPIDAYHRVDWASHPYLQALLAPGGGHVGFHSRNERPTWHDHCIERFFEPGNT